MRSVRPLWLSPSLLIATAVALVAAAAIVGCNIIAGGAYIIEGPPKKPAMYTLPKEKIVVFVDDRSTIIPRSSLRRALAMRATELLVTEKELVPGGVTPEAATRIAAQEEYGEPLSIAEIGRRVGAGVVIYAVPERFGVYSVDGLPQPSCSMRVRVIDVDGETQLWPADGSYHQFAAEMSMKSQPHYDRDKRDQFELTLAQFTGMRLAQLFYEHEPNPLDGRTRQ